ncbi:uncharacterized protein LOC133819960 [Humulus lupulus]|uniref:uncharacterized protein LOC133819960 n=1 Tax=Humulus lupulus TaxID=3486 RepID=UPI002B40239F|nr:uncharacterized protein LOC133819960 [Humulus lupulus]
MSRWNIRRKLSPAKRAWKTITTRLQPKILDIINLIKHSNIPTAIKTTSRRLLYTLSSFLPTKLRSISNPSSATFRRRQTTTSNHNYSYNYSHQPVYKNFPAIHIDELFPYSTGEQPRGLVSATAGGGDKSLENKSTNIVRRNTGNNIMYGHEASSSNRNNDKGKRSVVVEDGRGDKDMKRVGSNKSIYSVEEAWMAVVASSPQLRGVDERAEEFISNFREDMKLQKEKSILEFHEMLKRSA